MTASSNISLQPMGLSVKHFARMKSKTLATEPRGSAWRSAKQARSVSVQREVAYLDMWRKGAPLRIVVAQWRTSVLDVNGSYASIDRNRRPVLSLTYLSELGHE